MKYDLTKKRTKFAERTLTAFSDALMTDLKDHALEDITVNGLCDDAHYPRATFYNYFDDIYDLLDYCWTRIAGDIDIGDYAKIEPERRTRVLFERCYDYMHLHQDEIHAIVRHNKETGHLQESLRRFIKKTIFTIIEACPCSEKYQVPHEMIAEHYASTIEMLLEWGCGRKDTMDRDSALAALDYLLGNL